MKCKNCLTEVPPTFASALIANKCPACGKEIMSGKELREIIHFKNLLSGLQLEDRLVITIAAALSAKFDLVPKGQAAPDAGTTPTTPAPEAQVDPFAHLDDEQRAREKALLEAKRQQEAQEDAAVVSEWGLEKGTSFVVKDTVKSKKIRAPAELVEMFDPGVEIPAEAPPEAFASAGGPKSIDRMARLAKAEAARMDPSQVKVRRKD